MLERVVVVGASLAGMRGAETLRREGYEGRLTIVGAEKHWPSYDRPPLSKELLAGKWPLERALLRTELDPAADDDLDLRLGHRAIAADVAQRTITLDDDTTVEWDGLVVATGSAPRTLPGSPIAAAPHPLRGIHVLRTIDDLTALRADLDAPATVAIVGAGFIGCEVAATARELGHPVHLIEALAQPLQLALGDGMGSRIAELHREHGVELHLGQFVAAIEGTDRVDAVTLVDGTRIQADVVLVAIGVSPTTGWLEGSGLVLDDGVLCDETLAAVGTTPDNPVVAAGDIARWPHPLYDGELHRIEHWTNAAEQGAHAARTLLGRAEPFASVPYVWSFQYGTRFQLVGTTQGHERTVEAEDGVTAYLRGSGRNDDDGGGGGDERVIGALCVNRPNRTVAYRNAIEQRATWPLRQ